MSAKTVRAVGILAFAMFLIVPASGFLFALSLPEPEYFNIDKAGENVLSMLALMYFVFLAFVVSVFWATQNLFNASGYQAADAPIMSLIICMAFFPPVAVLFWTWFSIAATGYGRHAGSRLWQAIGIIYLIGMVLIITSMVSIAFHERRMPNFDLLVYATPALLAGWACHGAGLIVDARKMAQT